MQLLKDGEDEYVPDKQLEQTVAEELEYDPAAHAPVTAVKPVMAQYEPAVHAVQVQNTDMAVHSVDHFADGHFLRDVLPVVPEDVDLYMSHAPMTQVTTEIRILHDFVAN